jgi:ribose/xylose/arabinose/galactoside ABC-type transport system permease subunit
MDALAHPLLKRLLIQPPLLPLLVLTLFVEGFWSVGNLRTLIDAVSIDGLVVIGMTIVMIAGGFDLSVGAVMAVSGVTAVSLLPHGIPASIGGAIAAGLLCGCLSGAFVTKLRINPFIATLAVMVIVRGAVLTYTDTRPIVGLDDAFLAMGGAGAIPVPALFLAVAAIAAYLLLQERPWGRHVYALGADERAARMAGLRVDRLKMQCYALSGALAGLAGFLLAARLGTGSPIIGESTPLTAAAAALIGGATLRGGEGSVPGALAGLLFVGMFVNLMNLLDVPSYYQRMAIGGILLALVVAEGTFMRLRPR